MAKYKLHVFTSSDNFVVDRLTGNPAIDTIEYLVVAGGGGSGGSAGAGNFPFMDINTGGGGGAGGFLTGNANISTTGTFSVVVGGGGAGGIIGYGPLGAPPVSGPESGLGGYRGSPGSNSSILGIVSYGGGGGGGKPLAVTSPTMPGWAGRANPGLPGGSGGGSGGGPAPAPITIAGGANVSGQGYPGGSAPSSGHGSAIAFSSGGGGAGDAGQGAVMPPSTAAGARYGGNGGIGVSVTWVPESYGTSGPTPGRWFAGGGGGAGINPTATTGRIDGVYASLGGAGGGGRGIVGRSPTANTSVPEGSNPVAIGEAGFINTGGGGGASAPWQHPNPAAPGLIVIDSEGAAGGSGIIIIRYPLVSREELVQPKVSRVSNIVANTSTVTTGDIVSFTVSTVNAANGEILYYSTNNQPNAAFVSGNTGSFTVNGNVGTVTLSISSGGKDEEFFDLQIRRGSSSGPLLRQGGNVYIDIPTYVEATGGTIIDSDGYRIHVFTSTANLVVTQLPAGDSNAEVILIGGGGGGGAGRPGISPSWDSGAAGGGGAGGFLQTNITLTSGSYLISVGGGGAGTPNSTTTERGIPGSNTSAFGLVAIGGGGGGSASGPVASGLSGGSGGGAGAQAQVTVTQGSAGSSLFSQGSPGGPSRYVLALAGMAGGGGGGAGGAGQISPQRMVYFNTLRYYGGEGGIGKSIPWIPASYGQAGPQPGRYFAGGGGGASLSDAYNGPGTEPAWTSPNGNVVMMGGLAGIGGGGQGSGYIRNTPTDQFWYFANNMIYATSGNVNTGGGGGAGSWDAQNPDTPPAGLNQRGAGPGMSGGSGIVIIRYPYQ
jgi:hypothetical protein